MTQPPQPTLHTAASGPKATGLARGGVRRFSVVQLLIALLLLFVTAPFVEDLQAGDVIEALLMTLVLVLSVLAVGGRRRTLALAIVLVTPALVGKWINHVRPDLVSRSVFLAAGLVFLGFIVVNLLMFILRAPRVDSEVLCAGLSTYLLLGLAWALAYMLAAQLVPNSFAISTGPASHDSMERFTSFYFSFITLTTVGYGDITPTSNVARMLAIMEAMTGTLFVAVFISRLVALYSSQSQTTDLSGQNDAGRPKI